MSSAAIPCPGIGAVGAGWIKMSQVKGLLSPLLEKQRMKVAKRFIKGGSVLDIGCGEGKLLEYLMEGAPYLGIDINADSIRQAKAIRSDETNVEFRAISLNEDPRLNRKFDNIVLLAVIEHLVNPEESLTILKNYLKEDGRMIITTPGPVAEKIHRIGARLRVFDREAQREHKKIFNKRELHELAGNIGLRVHYYSTFEFGLNNVVVMVHA
jgi:2-polyprenyl-3-methyl-5-hydroxy-6-metoxy-1,4-benzoquinol methylase